MVLPACNDPLVDTEEAAAARQHLENVLQVMEAHALHRRTIDWLQFRATVKASAPEPNNFLDAFQAIYVALGLLGDNHSWYVAPPGYRTEIRNSPITCSADRVLLLDVPSDIGYVRVSTYAGTPEAFAAHAAILHLIVAGRDRPDLAGWIVDLRSNSSSNMWADIAGLGSLLGERVVGYSVDPDGGEGPWEYSAGSVLSSGQVVMSVPSPYTLISPDPKVVVLTDGRVAGGGEAAAVAFKGRPNTRFLGTPTCGLSTATAQYAVDGAALVLAVAGMADRTRTVYADTLRPDEVIVNATQLRDRAVAWIRGVP